MKLLRVEFSTPVLGVLTKASLPALELLIAVIVLDELIDPEVRVKL